MSAVSFDAAVKEFDPVLGIEVHVELNTKTKMFCPAPNEFGAEPNTLVSPVSLGLPGALPVLNEKGLEYAIKLGLALNCKIAEVSGFARKNYFYPDIPKNFQTSQSDDPIAYDGYLDVILDDGEVYRVEIERAHMEEDAGKNTHVGGSSGRIHGATYSLVDYNRSGVPLIEIVTKPMLGVGERAPEIARAYVQTLRDIVRALDISDARMERGNVRADINVSLRADANAPLGTRTETKNVNSFRSIERAVRYEISRHAEVLRGGGSILQETRHFHDDTGTTSSGRPKSDADDYRYFPEPDLVPVVPDPEWVEQLRSQLPELPQVRRRRLQEEWKFTTEEMRDVVNAGSIDLIEATVAAGTTPAAARKWWLGELSRIAGEREISLEDLSITPQRVAGLQQLIDDKKINDKIARQVLPQVIDQGKEPADVVAEQGLEIVSDDSALEAAVDEALAAQPDVVDKIKAGRVQAAGAIVGAVMKATRGQADAARVREIVMAKCQE